MAVGKKTVKDINLAGKRVLLRADYNVPVEDGRVASDFRLRQSVPTIEYILKQKPAGLIIISHLGRPRGRDKNFSLRPVAQRLAQLVGREVKFINDCHGSLVELAANNLSAGGILMLENVRYYSQEEANDKQFAKQLIEATGAEVLVQDAFGVVHRRHATTDAITSLVPAVAGLLLANELATISQLMEKPRHPVVAIVGGAKIADKIEVLNKLIEIADCVAVGGAMANDFLVAEGYSVGRSKTDKSALPTARKLLRLARQTERRRPFSFILPVDVVVSSNAGGRSPTRVVDLASHSLADILAYPKRPPQQSYTVGPNEMILDIGPVSAAQIAGVIKLARTVIWNGTLGVTETKGIAAAQAPFAHATNMVIQAMAGLSHQHPGRPYSFVGGGDTAGYVESQGLTGDFDFVSTGGGAALDLMAGKQLPGVSALQDK